jgi:PIN domain
MHYLLLDTNTWIYLANGTEPVRLLTFIKEEVDAGNIRVLLPDIIINEWDRNKESTVKVGTLKYFNEATESLERISKLLGDKGERNVFSFLLDEPDEKDYFKDVYDKLRSKREEIEEAIHENIKLIDELFAHVSTIVIQTKQEVMVKAGETALKKEPPFLKKNSFADAVIFFSFIDYVKANAMEGAFFITYNTDDFCEKKEGKKTLHKNMAAYIEDVKAGFYTIVGEALNTIKEDILSKEEIELIRLQQEEARYEDSIEYCGTCDNEGNEVYLNDKVHILDHRTQVDNANQMEFDFAQGMRKTTYEKLSKFMVVGKCNWCDTFHFQCPSCDNVNAVDEDEFDAPKYCEGCGLLIYIDTSNDYENIGEGHVYMIIDETKTCEKCGEDQEYFNGETCPSCEDEVAYGIK